MGGMDTGVTLSRVVVDDDSDGARLSLERADLRLSVRGSDRGGRR